MRSTFEQAIDHNRTTVEYRNVQMFVCALPTDQQSIAEPAQHRSRTRRIVVGAFMVGIVSEPIRGLLIGHNLVQVTVGPAPANNRQPVRSRRDGRRRVALLADRDLIDKVESREIAALPAIEELIGPLPSPD